LRSWLPIRTMVAMTLPSHLSVHLAAEHRRDLQAVSEQRRPLLRLTRSARRHRRAPRA
jgi:hypothetical protein